jgi:hypothetical protein
LFSILLDVRLDAPRKLPIVSLKSNAIISDIATATNVNMAGVIIYSMKLLSICAGSISTILAKVDREFKGFNENAALPPDMIALKELVTPADVDVGIATILAASKKCRSNGNSM